MFILRFSMYAHDKKKNKRQKKKKKIKIPQDASYVHE